LAGGVGVGPTSS